MTTSGFVSATGTLTDGLHTVAASVANATGRGPTKSWEFFVDSQVPTVTLTAAPSGSTSLLVSWQGSDPAPSSGIQGYEVQYKVGDDPDWTPWLTNTTNTNATFQATLVQTYTFQVRAIDNAGNQSNWVQTGPVEAGAVTKYYLFGDQRVAMRQGSVVYYLNGDHLGSVSLTTDQSGNIVSEVRYLPYGEERWTDGASPTDFGFTSQRNEASFGLMDYNARYYDPFLGRFISPDTLVPEPGNPQAFNRYAYTLNNPVKFTDPSGHEVPNICLWCNKEIANTKNWSDLALSLAEVGCVAAGCHVDREANVIRGPTTEEFASTFGLDFINPLGFATVGAGRGLSRLGKETVGEVSKTILRKTQQGVSDVIQPHLDAITQLAPDAQVGFRGSLARGTKGPHKQNAPFDPTDFDIDAFIVSDELAARYSKNQWWRSGDAIPELKAIQDQIGMVLKEQFPGLRDEPFTFRIYTSDEFTRKVKPDEQFFIK